MVSKLRKEQYRFAALMQTLYWSMLEPLREDERGDTNFISILIILALVVILAGVFMRFKDLIVAQVEEQVNSFSIA